MKAISVTASVAVGGGSSDDGILARVSNRSSSSVRFGSIVVNIPGGRDIALHPDAFLMGDGYVHDMPAGHCDTFIVPLRLVKAAMRSVGLTGTVSVVCVVNFNHQERAESNRLTVVLS